MSGEKIIEATELIAPGTVSDSPLNLSEKEMEKGDDSVTPMPAVADATSGAKTDVQPEQGVFYPPASYEYYYPGYNGTFADDKGYCNAAGGSYTGTISDNNLYYYPGYGSYTTGYASAEYLQQPCSYGSDAFPCYSYDSTYSGNVSTGTAAQSDSSKPVMGPSGSGKSNGYSNPKMNSGFSSKTTSHPSNSKAQQQSSSFSKPAQNMKSTNKIDSMKGYQPSSKFTFTNRHPDYYAQFNPAIYQSNSANYHSNRANYHSNRANYQSNPVNYQSNPVNYQSNSRASYNNNYRYKSREVPGRNPEPEALSELTRGPRSDRSRNSSPKLSAAEAERAGLPLDSDNYNSKEFKIEYDDAKFFVIKSYSEDDVHKCMKYDVWSSTPNGNKKLDAAYREADAKTSEMGDEKTCPIFLFFSVNGSGQFVGVAEMIGQVDFTKNMDFWQLDKWNGFFPLKWHIIKDVPNTLLRHIILENNDNKSVTYSRDTQEIGLKQGLEMLGIFKNYSERTSVLDDFNFYENREKSFKMKKNAKLTSQFDGPKNSGGYEKQFKIDEEMAREQLAKTDQSDPSALISLTKNLSLNSQSLQSS